MSGDVQIILAIIAILPGVLALLAQRRSSRSDELLKAAGLSSQLAGEIRADAADLRSRLAESEKKIAELVEECKLTGETLTKATARIDVLELENARLKRVISHLNNVIEELRAENESLTASNAELTGQLSRKIDLASGRSIL
jgi:septal ring factor EnvC (AmiA/AmiB activator)